MKQDQLWRTLQVILFIGVMFLLIEMPQMASRLIEDAEASLTVASLLSFLVYPLMYGAVILFLRWEGDTSLGDLGTEIREDTVPGLIIGLIGGIAGAGIAVLLAALFEGDLRPLSDVSLALVLGNGIITVLVCYVEELAYRGYLLSRSSKLGAGKPFGIILSSIVFSLLHYSWWTPLGIVPLHLILLFTFNLFLGGVVLSAAYYMSGQRLWAPMGFHYTWNMLAYILFPVYPRETVQNPVLFQIEWGITTIPAFLVGFVVMWLLLNLREKR